MNIWKRSLVEMLGLTGLLIVIVGSGIMGETLSKGNPAIALLANSLASAAGLFVLIQTFGSVSEVHFNPVVSLVEYIGNRISTKELCLFITSQFVGAIGGVWLAHVMFGLEVLQLSNHDRGDLRFVISETVATFGLILVVLLAGRKKVELIPFTVSAYILSAYWCTSSTSFANPAVTIARSLSNTFSGISWANIPSFVVAQVIGASAAYFLTRLIAEENKASSSSGL